MQKNIQWQLILSDVMALMLSFFVMLFSISSLKQSDDSAFIDTYLKYNDNNQNALPQATYQVDNEYERTYILSILQHHLSQPPLQEYVKIYPYSHQSPYMAELVLSDVIQGHLIQGKMPPELTKIMVMIHQIIGNLNKKITLLLVPNIYNANHHKNYWIDIVDHGLFIFHQYKNNQNIQNRFFDVTIYQQSIENKLERYYTPNRIESMNTQQKFFISLLIHEKHSS